MGHWDNTIENPTIWISDGETRTAGEFSRRATDETIIRDYLQDYGYTDPELLIGKWQEGQLHRDGRDVDFWWKLTGRTACGRYEYVLRFGRPAAGEVRHDGYRY